MTGVSLSADPDGDGVSNLAEFVADTNPTNSASYLAITSIQPVAGGVWIEWQGGTAAIQRLQRLDDLNSTNWLNLSTVFPPTPSVGSRTNFLEGSLRRFYRIEASRP